MQSFLPYSSYLKSAQVLDRLRLGKMRLESLTILKTNLGLSKAWASHPCTKQWKGFELSLAHYCWEIIQEWKRRGYKDSCEEKLLRLVSYKEFYNSTPPFWMCDEDFHSRHRAALLYKNYGWYSQFGWTEMPILDYKWFDK